MFDSAIMYRVFLLVVVTGFPEDDLGGGTWRAAHLRRIVVVVVVVVVLREKGDAPLVGRPSAGHRVIDRLFTEFFFSFPAGFFAPKLRPDRTVDFRCRLLRFRCGMLDPAIGF